MEWPTLQAEEALRGLRRVKEKVRGHGLVLREEEMLQLAARRVVLLRQAGRIEFGEGVLPKLAFLFCDSPYIAQGDYAATLEELLACFYHYKNECGDRLSDDELLDYMKEHFDGDCHGSLEYLAGTLLEPLCQRLRTGEVEDADDTPDEEGEPDDE